MTEYVLYKKYTLIKHWCGMQHLGFSRKRSNMTLELVKHRGESKTTNDD